MFVKKQRTKHAGTAVIACHKRSSWMQLDHPDVRCVQKYRKRNRDCTKQASIEKASKVGLSLGGESGEKFYSVFAICALQRKYCHRLLLFLVIPSNIGISYVLLFIFRYFRNFLGETASTFRYFQLVFLQTFFSIPMTIIMLRSLIALT